MRARRNRIDDARQCDFDDFAKMAVDDACMTFREPWRRLIIRTLAPQDTWQTCRHISSAPVDTDVIFRRVNALAKRNDYRCRVCRQCVVGTYEPIARRQSVLWRDGSESYDIAEYAVDLAVAPARHVKLPMPGRRRHYHLDGISTHDSVPGSCSIFYTSTGTGGDVYLLIIIRPRGANSHYRRTPHAPRWPIFGRCGEMEMIGETDRCRA